MWFRCPHCEEQIQLFQIPQESETVRCTQCGQAFSISGSTPGVTDDKRSLSEETQDGGKKMMPQQEEPSPALDEMKALAQQYFADIPDVPVQESAAPVSKPIAESEKTWSSEDDLPEEDKRIQRELLFQFAQETASQAEEAQPLAQEQEQVPLPAKAKSVVQEKQWQRGYYQFLLLLVFILPSVRIYLGRTIASIEQFNWMQPQIVPSLLYCIAAALLLFSLLRRTAKPRPITAALLFIPLVFDFWYLIPGIGEHMPPDTLLNISNALKIAVSAFALIMSLKPRKHSAL